MQRGGSEHDPCHLALIMDNTSHYSRLRAKVFCRRVEGRQRRVFRGYVSQWGLFPARPTWQHVCCVMEKSKSLPVNQFSAPCMLPRAEWQQKIQPQTSKHNMPGKKNKMCFKDFLLFSSRLGLCSVWHLYKILHIYSAYITLGRTFWLVSSLSLGYHSKIKLVFILWLLYFYFS